MSLPEYQTWADVKQQADYTLTDMAADLAHNSMD